MKNNTSRSEFAQLMRDYERATTDIERGLSMQLLARACAYSVLKKLLDPQAKDTDGKETKGGNGFNPAITKLKKSLYADTLLLDMLNDVSCNGNGRTMRYDTNGNPKEVITDKAAYDRYNAAIDRFLGKTLSDAHDLIQVAALALLEQTTRADTTAEHWLEQPYNKRALTRKVYIDTADADKEWTTVETTPIQEVFKAIRRYVMDNRSINIDPRCKYVYLSELVTDPDNDDTIDQVYRRLPRYMQAVNMDIHIDHLGGVTTLASVGHSEVDELDRIIDKLNLTTREASVLNCRLQGYGYKVIANSLHITENAAKGCLRRVRDKARKEFNIDL